MKKSFILTAIVALSHGSMTFAADMYVRTASTGWANQGMTRSYCSPSTNTQNCVYLSSTITPTATDQFKFDIKGDWSVNYGDNNIADAYVDSNGANIAIGGNHFTKVAYEFNSNNGKPFYRIHRDDCGNMGVWGDLYNRSQRLFGGTYGQYGQYYCYQTIQFNAPGVFYFTQGAATLGESNDNLELNTVGTNPIEVPQAGEYKLTYNSNFGRPVYTISRYGSMYLRGSFNDWSKTGMQMVKKFVWSAGVTFTANTPVQLKFDAFGDWGTNFGDNNADKIADAGGSNITLISPVSGYIPVRFNELTHKYAVCTPSASSYDAQLCQ